MTYDRARAAKCLDRANRSTNRADKLAWLQLTESWLVIDKLLAEMQSLVIAHDAPPLQTNISERGAP